MASPVALPPRTKMNWSRYQMLREMYAKDPTNRELGKMLDASLDAYCESAKQELPYLCVHK